MLETVDQNTGEKRLVRVEFNLTDEMISSLTDEDRQELIALTQQLFSREKTDVENAVLSIRSLLESKQAKLIQFELEKQSNELQSWLDFVSARIREARTKAGLTQTQLAKSAGLPQSHISRLEKGKHSPSHLTLQKIAKALSIPIHQLDPSSED